MEWNQMIPEFDVFNLEESIHFYVDLIGFHIVYDRKEDKFAFLQLENVQIMIQEIIRLHYMNNLLENIIIYLEEYIHIILLIL